MSELTLESLAHRLAELEHRMNEKDPIGTTISYGQSPRFRYVDTYKRHHQEQPRIAFAASP